VSSLSGWAVLWTRVLNMDKRPYSATWAPWR